MHWFDMKDVYFDAYRAHLKGFFKVHWEVEYSSIKKQKQESSTKNRITLQKIRITLMKNHGNFYLKQMTT